MTPLCAADDAIKADDGGSPETYADQIELHKNDEADTFDAYAIINEKSKDTPLLLQSVALNDGAGAALWR